MLGHKNTIESMQQKNERQKKQKPGHGHKEYAANKAQIRNYYDRQ